MAASQESTGFNRLVFPKDTKQFGVWKDLIIGHLRQKSAALTRETMTKHQEKPAFKYEVMLVTSCDVPHPRDGDDEEAMKRYDWQMVLLNDQESYVRNLLNQTLPRSYLESRVDSFNDAALPVPWRQLEKDFGQSNAQGMAQMMASFDEALSQDFSSVQELICRVKEVRMSDDDDVDDFEPGNVQALAGQESEASTTIEEASASIEKTTLDAATV